MESINAKLALVMKSGKALLGYKSTLKSLRTGKCAPSAWRMPTGTWRLWGARVAHRPSLASTGRATEAAGALAAHACCVECSPDTWRGRGPPRSS